MAELVTVDFLMRQLRRVGVVIIAAVPMLAMPRWMPFAVAVALVVDASLELEDLEGTDYVVTSPWWDRWGEVAAGFLFAWLLVQTGTTEWVLDAVGGVLDGL